MTHLDAALDGQHSLAIWRGVACDARCGGRRRRRARAGHGPSSTPVKWKSTSLAPQTKSAHRWPPCGQRRSSTAGFQADRAEVARLATEVRHRSRRPSRSGKPPLRPSTACRPSLRSAHGRHAPAAATRWCLGDVARPCSSSSVASTSDLTVCVRAAGPAGVRRRPRRCCLPGVGVLRQRLRGRRPRERWSAAPPSASSTCWPRSRWSGNRRWHPRRSRR